MENIYIAGRQINVKKAVIFTSLLLIAIFAFSWFYNHAFIKITVAGTANGKHTYKLVNQENGDMISVENDSTSFKKLAPKGNYEVLVSNEAGSYFSVIKTKSFLRTTTLDASLEPGKKRQFVGDNPGPCSYYDQDILISYSCAGDYSDLQAHVPASAETPTYTQNNEETDFSKLSLGGIIKLNDKKMVFAESLIDSQEAANENRLFRLLQIDDALNVADGSVLKGLDTQQFHKIQNYKRGFVVYPVDYSFIQYYSDARAAPQELSIKPPEDAELTPSDISIRGERIAVAYSDKEEVGENLDQEKSPGDKTIIQLHEADNTKSFVLDDGYTSMELCGQNSFCYLNGEDLTVYDISGQKQKELFKMAGVKSVESVGDQLIIVKDDMVVGIDANSGTGSIQYSFGEYQFCGLQNTANEQGYVLCIITPENSRTALYIDPRKPNEDNIDKKILDLATNLDIDSISIYKNFVYIAPEFGELVYDPAINGYASAPAVRKQVNASIAQSIRGSAIDTRVYQIFRPLR